MDSREPARPAATEDKGYYMTNRRTLEFLILAGVLGIGMPISVLLGVEAGEKTAAVIYPKPDPAGEDAAADTRAPDLYLSARDLWSVVRTVAVRSETPRAEKAN